ncbi:unnamed protein product [Timema podura]|uniref:Uncharacterized protein n=1 Tax=Timema podura TaxID=61482 RepID=A0ABN7P4N8_TIMPD|nr:unnamed protein product [Timema podura]
MLEPEDDVMLTFACQIRGHPKVKVFITQGGLQSVEEAITMGVPLIGIPFFADQDFNVKKIVERGIGIKIEFTDVTKESVLKSLKNIIHDNRFRENIKRLSVLREDMPDKPLRTCSLVDGVRTKTQRCPAPAHCSC